MKKYSLAYKYLAKYSKKIFLVAVIGLISSVFEGFSIGMLIPFFQNIISGSRAFFNDFPILNKINFLFAGKTPKDTLLALVVFIFIIILLKNIFAYINSVLSAKLRYGAIGDFRENLLDKILYCGNKYYDSVKSGHLVSNVYYETLRIGAFLNAVLNILVIGVKIAVYASILVIVSWRASIVVCLAMLVIFPFIQKIIKKVKLLGDIGSAASSRFNFILLEILNGIRVIKSFGTENYEKERFKKADNEYIDSSYKCDKYNSLISPLTETIILSLFVAVFLLVLNAVNIDISKFVPFVLVYAVLFNRAMQQLNVLNIYRGQLANNLSAFESYKNIEEGADKFKITSGNKTIQKLEKEIEFKNVDFSYIEGREVLKNINIKIQKGKTTAVVGATGSGKSTLVNLIPRFYDTEKGEIIVDGINIKDLDLRAWRKKIGIVSQDVFIFNDSIRENIRYGNFDASDEVVEGAAKVANADEFINDRTEGYNTVVGERGVRLSGGQKQRISIARAIINNPEILILDEATSAMDTKTERLIQDAVDNLTKNRTVVAIAHRLSTIQSADEIIVLEGGVVVEKGKHAELMQAGGHYKAYYNLQYNKV